LQYKIYSGEFRCEKFYPVEFVAAVNLQRNLAA
jgi:hypothetical protein